MKCPHCNKKIPDASPGKVKYSEFVEMTAKQHKQLIDRFGYKQTVNLIYRLDLAIPNQLRKPYKCHYRAILSWVVDELEVKPLQKKRPEPKDEEPLNRGSVAGFEAIADAQAIIRKSTGKHKEAEDIRAARRKHKIAEQYGMDDESYKAFKLKFEDEIRQKKKKLLLDT